jgi:hypothetical protein
MSDTFRTVVVAALTIAAAFTWQGVRTVSIPVSAPERLIAELRLAQIAALLLAMTAGSYIGFAVAHENQPASSIDVALAVGFFVAAAATLVRDPRQALTILAAAFVAHALVDIGHRPGLLAEGIAPRWYAIGCAVFDVYIGAIAYSPILRR